MAVREAGPGYRVSDARVRELGDEASEHAAGLAAVEAEAAKAIVGQRDAIRKMLVAAAAGGHVLLEGVPGIAKTLMASTLATALGLDHVRIQFTPDLLPADIVGTRIYEGRSGGFVTQKGPVFHSMVLADEINRAPPKVQSALLEAMQEGAVTIHGDTHALPDPFLVIATQNPVESEGTYALPEAQTDRFALKVQVGYPGREDELEIIERNSTDYDPGVGRVMDAEKLAAARRMVGRIYADPVIAGYVTDIVGATRDPAGLGLDGMIARGASPRASIWMVRAAKASALMAGRGYVIPEDVREMARDVLRHRISLSFEAEAVGLGADRVVETVLEKTGSP